MVSSYSAMLNHQRVWSVRNAGIPIEHAGHAENGFSKKCWLAATRVDESNCMLWAGKVFHVFYARLKRTRRPGFQTRGSRQGIYTQAMQGAHFEMKGGHLKRNRNAEMKRGDLKPKGITEPRRKRPETKENSSKRKRVWKTKRKGALIEM